MKELARLRKEKDITQDTMALYIGVTKRQFCRYEYGEVDIPFKKAKKWASKLGLSMNQFERIYK